MLKMNKHIVNINITFQAETLNPFDNSIKVSSIFLTEKFVEKLCLKQSISYRLCFIENRTILKNDIICSKYRMVSSVT